MTTPQPTIQQLADGCLQFLKENKPAYALQIWIEFSDIVESHPTWTPRFHAWFAQAHLALRQPKEAMRHCHAGRRTARAIQDQQGVEVCAQLLQQASAMLVAMTEQSTAGSSLLEQADQAIRAEDWPLAKQCTSESLASAIAQGDNKMEILSLLSMARIPSEQEQAINRAYHRTQEMNDMNLITLVKKSMDSLGIEIPTHTF